MSDRAGQRLDNYHLLHLLGAGSFGEVYLAEHVYRKDRVALKLLPQLADSDLAGFLNEARTIRLKHSHIVQILDFGVDHHVPFIVMDYAPNGTLRQRHPKGKRVPLNTIVFYVKQIASALQYAHDERIIHRDIKPENLLLGRNDEVLVSDFGIATIAHSSRSGSLQEMAGTVAYMAPEQIQGKPRFASDQYALGIIVYEWLCGDRPFNGSYVEVASQHILVPPPPLRERISGISDAVEGVVLKALAKDPKDRFTNVQAFALALEQAHGEQLPNHYDVHSLPPNTGLSAPVSSPAEQQQGNRSDVIAMPFENTDPSPLSIAPLSSTTKSTLSSPTSFLIPSPSYRSSPSSQSRIAESFSIKKGLSQPKRMIYPALALFALLIIALGGGAYYLFQPKLLDVDALLTQASQLVNEAQAEVTSNPSDALQKLAQAQAAMRQAQTVSLSSAQHAKLQALLQGNFTTTAKAAITSYNRQALITPLSLTTPCVNATAAPVNSGNTGTQAASLAVIQDGKGNLFSYALGTDHNLYPLNTQHSFGNKVALPQPKVAMLASDSQRLFALMVQPGDNNGPSSYSLGLLTAKSNGDLQMMNTANIDPNLMKGGLAPKLITAWGNDVYVLLTSDSTPNTAEILDYTADKNNKLNGNAHSARISVSTSVISMAAFSGGQLFLLYSNGDVQSLQFASQNQAAVSVVLQSPIAPSLAVSPSEFTPATPVPTSAAQPTKFLSVPGATLLAAGTVGGTAHLYIADGAYHRILDLQEAQASASATPTNLGTSTGNQGKVTMHLVQQYASTTLLPATNSLIVDPKGANIYLLVQNPQNNPTLNLLSIQLQTQNSCTP
jgi:serine/threonine protein kinase